MAGEPKKISFGFSKISKKPSVVPQKNEEEKDIQFINGLEDNSIKLVNGEESGKSFLTIPLKQANVLRDNVIETLKARKEERSLKHKKNINDDKKGCLNGIDEEDKKPLTLDEMAAKEILEDLKKTPDQENTSTIREIPATNTTSAGEKESTLENYENTPIQEFGLAVLRGMGWTPESDIVRNGQIVQPENPVLRTKGLGLGADKVLPTTKASNNSEELVMKKNAMLKVISGPYKNLYGIVEGFEDLPGRLMVRLTLRNSVVSISENLVQLVTKAEYSKCSKVLNLDNYNKFNAKKNEIVCEEKEKHCRREMGRSPSNSEGQETTMKQKRESRKSVSPHLRAQEKYSKPKKVKRSSSPSEPDKYLMKSSRSRSSSVDSIPEKRKHKNRRDRSSSLDELYSKRRENKKKRSSPSPEKQCRKQKNRRRSSSESSESDKTYKKSKKKRQNRRGSSTSSESEEDKRKSRKREISGNGSKKHKTSSSEERKYKSRYNTLDSSESEESRSSKVEKKAKHSKRDKYDSNLSPERTSRHKKHGHVHAKNHRRSRSPINKKKKKKKHRRSRS